MSNSSHRSISRELSPANLNRKYLQLLSKYPLLTKSVTALILNAFNEQIASFVAGDLKEFTIKIGSKEFKIKHTLTARVPLMALYGFLLNAPIAHYGYKLLNKFIRPPLSGKKKLGQILTSMITITPFISVVTVSYIALINNANFNQLAKLLINRDITGLKQELKRLYNSIKNSLYNSLFSVIKSSWISGPIFMFIAQKFLEPNLWTVFFSVCYFVLGTYNNAQVKMKAKLSSKDKKDDTKECDHPKSPVYPPQTRDTPLFTTPEPSNVFPLSSLGEIKKNTDSIKKIDSSSTEAVSSLAESASSVIATGSDVYPRINGA
ncbi:unnamed protein product [Ambrosiozyma monospora]|uniref:Unnamed protein product n=1 Tax=Ambrosiozyma monospora TaxID=43982 RepID=A0A9W7DFC2_AMBMO|nr:unnamed protein product [Ambrosiozyma monospora]